MAPLKDFNKTHYGIGELGRSGGFNRWGSDIAVRHLQCRQGLQHRLGNKMGKEAMDHYVSGDLNITRCRHDRDSGERSHGMVSFASQVGLAAGALMAIGSQVYGAVRMVDEIDDYVELTVEERWRAQDFLRFSFVPLIDIDQDVKHHYELAKAKIETARRLKTTARKLLDETQKDNVQAVVHQELHGPAPEETA